MENSTQDPKPKRHSREIRLGLVMYGGISLAIYINGVAREFYRAVRGESIYKLIKAFTDSDIVVDIISGTSAGGVNGVLLGYALCNKADFATTAELWRKAGDIGILVRDSNKLVTPVLSILDGEGHYQTELQDAFGRMDAAGWDDENIEPSPLTEMDVFITSTDVDGRVYNWIDAQGHTVDVKDHRAVFQLKFREGRKNDFAPDAKKDKHRALAKLSRMTSCFPAAFPPVRVAVNPRLTEISDRKYWAQWKQPDTMIAGWGRLTKDDSYFLDGGLLDNKPFTYTTREIFSRLADRAVERRLFYVEPDPETFEHNAPATQVNVIQAVQRALISIPGYESIADDLKALSAHNEKIYRYERLIGQGNNLNGLQLAAKRARESLDAESRNFIARIKSLEKGETPAEMDGAASRYAKARFIALSERAVLGILNSNEQEPRLEPAEKAAAAKLYKLFDEWDDPRDPNGDLTLYHFDVYFRLRRMFHVLYACPAPDIEVTATGQLRGQLLRAIGRQISLLEIIQAAMEKLVDEGNFLWRQREPQMVWGLLQSGYEVLLNADERDQLLPPGYAHDWSIDAPGEPWLGENSLDQVYQRLFVSKVTGMPNAAGRIGSLQEQICTDAVIARPAPFVSALTVTDACERRMLRYFDSMASKLPDNAGLPRLEQIYDDFILIDADLFTLQVFADLKEKDIIKTIRISPRDAQRAFCALDLKRKVAGDAVFHFGGFFKKSWRANDILWGRLDGLCQLTETLFERERVMAVIDNNARRAMLKKDIMADGKLHPAKLFPKALPKTQQALNTWFHNMVDDNPAVRTNATKETEWEKHLNLLVEAAQMEFLGNEVKNVLEDAVDEQMGWNLYRKTVGTLKDIDRTREAAKWDFRVGNGRFDPTVHALAAEAISGRAMAKLESPASLMEFFKNEYGVGAESIAKDVPLWVLLEILFRALLVAKASLLYALPSKWRDNVSGSPPFKVISATLWLLYGLASTLRSSNRMLLVWRSVVFGLALLSWCVAFFWGVDLVCGSNIFNKWAIALLLVPTVLLLASFRKLWLWAVFLAAIGIGFAFFGAPVCKWLVPGC